jgi:hypothetical protein
VKVAVGVPDGGTNGVQVIVGVSVSVGVLLGGRVVTMVMNVAVGSRVSVTVGVGVSVGARWMAIQPAQ